MFTQFNLLLGISYLADICSTEQGGLFYQVEYFLARTLLFGVLLIFMFKIVRPRFRKLVEILDKEWYVASMMACFFYIMEAVILYYPRMYWYETKLPMDEVALVSILANSFENAVEGCLRAADHTEKFVSVKIGYSEDSGVWKLHIVIINSCQENILVENGNPKSLKSGGGTGTRSIAYIAEKYHGMVEFFAENGVFRTRVLLHL